MAVAYLTFKTGDPVVVWCLSGDTKPAAQSTWSLLETDTGNRFIPNGTNWDPVGGGAAWGGVTGTLSAQTDLQAALDAKQAAGSYQPLATPLTNTTAAFTTAQETKLSGIATGATANATDADLRDRGTHTGAQAISTVTGLQTALDAKQPSDTQLTDFAALAYAGNASKNLRVNAGETGLELYTPSVGGIAAGVTTVNFGAFPGASDTKTTITGQASIVAGSNVKAYIMATATADHSADEHWLETLEIMAGNIVAGTGFDIYARNDSMNSGAPAHNFGGPDTRLYGQFTVAWEWI